jgi:hypothetical protein
MAAPAAGAAGGYKAPTSMRALMAAEKGVTVYQPGQAFLLHVMWEAPSMAAALELLGGLRKCAVASHRDTPCTVTYFFRVSGNNADTVSPTPATVGDLPALRDAKKRLTVGTPPPVVRNALTKMGIDPALLDAAPETPLPAALAARPVAVEFTEVYLDEQAFVEHAG